MTAWVVPTARAVEWRALTTLAGLLVGTSALAAYADRWPTGMVGIAAGAVAAATVAGLHDPAADLLSALPTSAAVRLAHRLALLVPAAVAVWLAYLGPGQLSAPDGGWTVAPMLALLVTGVAVSALAPPAGAVAWGVAVPLAWAAADRIGRLDPDLTSVLMAWQHHPWIVIAAALAALAWRRDR